MQCRGKESLRFTRIISNPRVPTLPYLRQSCVDHDGPDDRGHEFVADSHHVQKRRLAHWARLAARLPQKIFVDCCGEVTCIIGPTSYCRGGHKWGARIMNII